MVNTRDINLLCRNLDLIFKEIEVKEGKNVFQFIDFKNRRISYTEDEIKTRLQQWKTVNGRM